MKKVLVCKSDLLNVSETFVRDQALSLQQWMPTFVGMRRMNGLSLQGLDVTCLADSPTQADSIFLRTLRRFHLPHPGFVARLRKLHADLVHIHFGTDAVDFWPVVRCLGIPVVVTLHGYDIMTHSQVWASEGGARKRYPRRLIAMSRSPRVRFIAVSEAIRQRAIEFGLPAARVVVKYIGIDTEKFQPAGEPITERVRNILFVGRLVEKKGIRYLLEAFARLKQRHPDVSLTIVGDGPMRDEVARLARALDVAPQFVGSRTSEQIKVHLADARVFCLPSVRADNGDAEGFGMVLLEAQACGVPVVTSALGGAQEGMVDGVTGYAFAERDIGALTAALERILIDDELAARMSAAARHFVMEHFDLRQCTRTLERYYDEIIEQTA